MVRRCPTSSSAPREVGHLNRIQPSTRPRLSAPANGLPSNCLRRDGVRRIGQRRAVTRGRVRCRRYFQGCPRPGQDTGQPCAAQASGRGSKFPSMMKNILPFLPFWTRRIGCVAMGGRIRPLLRPFDRFFYGRADAKGCPNSSSRRSQCIVSSTASAASASGLGRRVVGLVGAAWLDDASVAPTPAQSLGSLGDLYIAPLRRFSQVKKKLHPN